MHRLDSEERAVEQSGDPAMSTAARRATLDTVAVSLGLPRSASFRPLDHGTDHQAFSLDDLVVRIDLVEDGTLWSR